VIVACRLFFGRITAVPGCPPEHAFSAPGSPVGGQLVE
jgi:hypothetical protein